MKHWFLPERPDLLGMLVAQGDVTVAGMEALCAWCRGEAGQVANVRAAEHRADAARRDLLAAVTRTFLPPINPEDLYELSERLDNVLNDAKNLVREADLLAMAPDRPMADMAAAAAAGVADLVAAFPLLKSDPDGATSRADRAVHHQRAVERTYRRAMSALLDVDEVREVMGRRELYRRCARMGDAVERVAHRIWYAVVKEG
ncbi:MAG TPA: DUF47 family protein [Acidimicrobiales bacterium]|nr:DUF47 family protein [Acidimicrobiales bacterium]